LRIDEEKCIGCERCLPYCPVAAIKLKDGKSYIDEDECYECGVCLRSGACAVNAFYFPETKWPRMLRAQFGGILPDYGRSDRARARFPGDSAEVEAPQTSGRNYSNIRDKITIPAFTYEQYKATGHQGGGRGTAEMKTNDKTGRYTFPVAGMALEFGRPAVGFRFYDIEKASMALAKAGVEFEPENPYSVLIDPKTGRFLDKYRDAINEKGRSAIIEFLVPKEKLPEMFEVCMGIAKEIDTVFTMDIISRTTPDGEVSLKPILEKAGIKVRINGKTNMGLGRPLIP
jgi:NAD-dependent dihydropyrimidine dehydrogenase PreA subunit